MKKTFIFLYTVIFFWIIQIFGFKNNDNTVYGQYAPTPTPYIRVRTIPFVSNENCRANCTNAPCVFSSCDTSGSSYTFDRAQSGFGGRINLGNDYVVLGVTPYQNGSVVSNGVYSSNCRGATVNSSCYYWNTALSTGSRQVNFVIATVTPTPTPTSTPIPTPGAWFKLKDSSLISSNSITSNIPESPVVYDADDTTDPYLIIDSAGAVLGSSVNVNQINSSAKTGNPEYKATYTPASKTMTPSNFLSYIKSRKEYKEISALNQINASGVYIYTGETLDLSSVEAALNQYNAVVIFNGTINITAQNFNPTKSVAFIADTISFSSSVRSATGLFIAGEISTGETTNQGLKISGGLIAQDSFDNDREWSNPSRPGLFIVSKPAIILDLIPYLSISNYKWTQLP